MKRSFERIAVLVLCLGIGWFYSWTVKSNGEPWNFGEEKRDYYNLLIDGYLAGQLHMKTEVPAALLQVSNPYDPQERPAGVGLHDASFYRGKYYVYFGAAPMVVLMLPFRLFTGMDMPLSCAVLVFVYAGFLMSVGVWLAVKRRCFPETGVFTTVLAVLVLGLAGVSAVLLRRPDMWELPIAGGYCFAMLAVGAVWRSLHSATYRAAWFAAAGVSLGLAIASRPTYLFTTPLLVPPLIAWWRSERGFPWRPAVSAIIPLAIIGALMAWHNHARFGSPLQFGQAYQFSLDYESKLPHFRAAYVPFNAKAHFFSAADWSAYFPFIHRSDLGEAPAGFTIHRGDVHGILLNFPIAWLAFLAPLALWRRSSAERRSLAAWLASVALLFVAAAGLMLFFFSALARYQMDFLPAFMLLAGIGLLGLERWIRSSMIRVPRVVTRGLVAVAAVFSAAFGVLFSLQYEGLLGENNPALQARVARRLNRLAAVIEKVARIQHGGLEMTLRVPSARVSGTETLATIGEPGMLDRVVIRYLPDGRVQLGIVPQGSRGQFSRALELSSDTSHRIRVFAGSLYPPSTHPMFAGRSADDIMRMKERVRIEVNGEPVLIGTWPGSAVERMSVRVGVDARVGSAHPPFRGSIEAFRRLDGHVWLPRRMGPFVRMRVAFAPGTDAGCEPLVAFGEDGSDGLLTVLRFANGAVRFRFLNPRGAATESSIIELAPRAVHELIVQFESMDNVDSRRMLMWADDQLVWAPPIKAPLEAREITVGRNPAGHAGCAPSFRGTIFSSQHDLDGRDPLVGRGNFRLQVRLPKDRAGYSEPLVVTGRPGSGDLLVIQYVDAHTVRFGLDHWGSAMTWSDPVTVRDSAPVTLDISMPSIHEASGADVAGRTVHGSLNVSVNGRPVWQQAREFYRAEADEVAIARNPIGGTSAGPRFTGDVLSATVARE